MPIPIISDIVPQNNGDFPTHSDIYGKGGYQVQPTTAARDAIPALRRKEGMVVFVVADGNEYRLNAGLTTWSIAGGGGGGTLAGDVTGPAASNVVERLTGLAGIVDVPTAALKFAGAAQTTGLIRAPTGVHIITVDIGAGIARGVCYVSSNTLTLGANILGGSAIGAISMFSSGEIGLFPSGVSTTAGYRISQTGFEFRQQFPSPLIAVEPKTNDSVTQTLTLRTQQPYASATGTNNTAGSLVLDLGTNANSYNGVFPDLFIKMQGANKVRFGYANTGGYNNGPFITIAPAAGGSTAAGVATDGMVRLPNGFAFIARKLDDTVNYPVIIGSNNSITFGGDLSATGYNAAILNGVGSAGLYVTNVPYVNCVSGRNRWGVGLLEWAITVTNPTILHAGQNVDAAPATLLVQPQAPFATATGTNRKPGDLRFDLGTPTNAGTTDAATYFRWRGDDAIQFTYDASVNSGPRIGMRNFSGGNTGALVTIVSGSFIIGAGAAGWGGTVYSTPTGTPSFIRGGSSTNVLTVSDAGVGVLAPIISFGETVSAPLFRQNTRTTDAAPQTLTIQTQAPFVSATGANNVPGNLVVDLGTNTNSYALAYPSMQIKNQGVTQFTFGYALAPFFSVGATPATTGAIRLPNNTDIRFRNAGNTADRSLLGLNSSGQITVGDTANEGALYLQTGTGASINASAGASILFSANAIAGGSFRNYLQSYTWNETVANPFIFQVGRSTNNQPQTLTIQPQFPFNDPATTGVNNKPGDVRFDLGTNTNGWITSYPSIFMRWGGTDQVAFSTSGTAPIMTFGVGNTPATIGHWRVFAGFTMYSRNAANTADIKLMSTDGSDFFALGDITSTNGLYLNTKSSTNVVFNPGGTGQSGAAISVGLNSFLWGPTAVPTYTQATRTSDTQPSNTTIALQKPYASATSATNGKPGDLVIDLGTPVAPATSYARVLGRTAGGVVQWQMQSVLDGSASNGLTLVGGASTGTDSYLQLVSGGGGTLNARTGTLTLNSVTTTIQVAGVNSYTFSASSLAMSRASGGFDINWSTTVVGARIYQSQHFTDSPANGITIQAQGAASGATGTNLNGAPVGIMGGARGTTAGRRRGVLLYYGASDTIAFGVQDAQAEATSPSRVVGIHYGNNTEMGVGRMPTGTGDLVTWVGDCASVPTVNGVAGHIYYSDGARPAWRFNGLNVRFDNISGTANAGAGGAPPAQVQGYFEISINGTTVKIPYYAV